MEAAIQAAKKGTKSINKVSKIFGMPCTQLSKIA